MLQSDALFLAGRRAFLGKGGMLLSGATIALLAGSDALAAKSGNAAAGNDVRILNTALGAEHQAVAAYQVGAESGLLDKERSSSRRSFRAITGHTSTCSQKRS